MPSDTNAHQDHYAVLGVDPAATDVQITRAYRVLLHRHHPDTRTGLDVADAHDDRLQQVLTAYAALHDPERRAAYDQTRGHRTPPRRDRPSTVTGPPVVLGSFTPHGIARSEPDNAQRLIEAIRAVVAALRQPPR